MKPILLFSLLTTVIAVPRASATSELETLRARCAAQEEQIQMLEARLGKSPSAGSQQNASGTYVVRSGDSLERIARRNSCSLAGLMKANSLKSSSIIQPGQKLQLPGTSAAASLASAPAKASKSVATPASLSGKTHTIRSGETFASISRKYGVSVNSLISANSNLKPTALRPGQVVQLSGSSSAVASKPSTPSKPSTLSTPATPSRSLAASKPSAPPFQTISTPVVSTQPDSNTLPVSAPLPSNVLSTPSAPEPAPEASAPAPSNTEKKIRSVTIEGEMTYGEFAAKHGTDSARLNDLNGLDLTNATVLAKGSELYVPAQP